MHGRVVSAGEATTRSTDAIAAEAALWLVRTAEGDAAGRRSLGLERWLSEHPGHRAAFADAKALWRDLGATAERSRFPAAATARPRMSRSTPRYGWVAAVAACLLMVVGLNSWFAARMSGIETGVGEQRTIRLADATKVMLNTDTRIEVEYDAKRRLVVLDRGEALFDVAHDPAKPFLVKVGDDYVRAVGTSFTVRRDARGLEVTLLEGSVIVGKDATTGRSGVRLRAGERLRTGGGGPPSIDHPVIDDVTAWRRGELVFDATPIGHAISEMNRYSDRPITLRGADMSGTKLSGVFETGDSEAFADTVAMIYGLRSVKTANSLILERKTAK